MKLIAYIDGASSGNPGNSGLGVVLQDEDGHIIEKHSEYVGRGTNNRAEYLALMKAVELAALHGANELEVRSDSQLVVRQMTGVYRIKNKEIQKIVIRLWNVIREKGIKFN
ncbi:MAG: ribonuclease HI family protein, partial [Candidatus Kryptoniota bacterium]